MALRLYTCRRVRCIFSLLGATRPQTWPQCGHVYFVPARSKNWIFMVFHKNWFFHYFKRNSGGLGVSRVTAPTIRSYMQIFSRFGLAWHRKVNFSTFSGKLTFQSTRNGPQNLPFCPGPLQDTFIIFPRYLTNMFFENMFNKTKIVKTENRKISQIDPEKLDDLLFPRDGPVLDSPWN